MVHFNTADNNYGTAKWIVDAQAGQGTQTTIQAAITAASSGDTIFIRPGTFTENLTLKIGVNLVAYDADALTPNVTIAGTCTLTTAGTVSISGIRLQTNSAPAIAVTGNAASILNLTNCYLDCTNNTGISFTSSSASALIMLSGCAGDLGTTGIAYWTSSSLGTIRIVNSALFKNSGGSSTASTNSSGLVALAWINIRAPISSSSTGQLSFESSFLDTSAVNATGLTYNGSGGSLFGFSKVSCGSASGVSVGTGVTLQADDVVVISSNTNAVTGLGALNLGQIIFEGSSSTINTSTVNSVISQMGTLNLKTALTVPNGGTGQTTLTNHGVIVGAGTSAVTQLAVGTTGQVLTGATGADPTWAAPAPPSGVITQFDVLVGGSASAIASVGPGSAGQVLQSGGNAANPVYSTATFPATATGTGTILRADGTNWAASTNTYPNTATKGDILYASASNVIGSLADVATGQVLTSGGVGNAPAYTAFPQVSGLGIGASPGSTAGLTFDATSFLNNYVDQTSWTPTLVGASTAGTTTYTAQNGVYVRIGHMIWITARIVITGATGTGDANLSLPFGVAFITNISPVGQVQISSTTWTFPALTTTAILAFVSNTSICTVPCYGSAVASSKLQMNNSALTIIYSGWYYTT